MKKLVFSLLISAILILTIAAVPANSIPTHNEGTIVVDAQQELAPVNPMLFGQNVWAAMPANDAYRKFYKDAQVGLLRFPAGSWGDENEISPINLDDLANLAGELDAQVVVQTRAWGEGTPENAAELVAYANIEKEYNFVYWEVGGEPDQNERRENLSGDFVLDIDRYNKNFREMAKAMKAVDPTIKIVGPDAGSGWQEWIPSFIKANGDIIDVISWHFYANENELSGAEVLDSARNIEDQVASIRAWWKDPQANPLGYQRPVPPLLLSEYNISASSSDPEQSGTQAAALWNAELLGRMANQGVEMGAYLAWQGTEGQALSGMEADPSPVYGIYRLFSHWGETQVKATSPDERLLPAFASRSEDGTVMVLVINKDPEQHLEVEIELKGMRPAGTMTAYLQDETHLATQLPDLPFQGSTFTDEMPPYSVMLFIIPASNSTALFAALGGLFAAVVLAGVFAWRRGSSKRLSSGSSR